MLRAPYFLFSLQYPLIHLLRLCHLALIFIEKIQVVDSVECECIPRVLYLDYGKHHRRLSSQLHQKL